MTPLAKSAPPPPKPPSPPASLPPTTPARGAFASAVARALAGPRRGTSHEAAPCAPLAPQAPRVAAAATNASRDPSAPAPGDARAPGGAPPSAAREDAPRARPPQDDPLDPSARVSAQIGPPQAGLDPLVRAGVAEPNDGARRGPLSLEQLLPALVRRVAWSGDGRRGAVRIELGAGRHDGATLLVQSDDARVRVTVGGRPGADLDALRRRIEARLAARGVEVESID